MLKVVALDTLLSDRRVWRGQSAVALPAPSSTRPLRITTSYAGAGVCAAPTAEIPTSAASRKQRFMLGIVGLRLAGIQNGENGNGRKLLIRRIRAWLSFRAKPRSGEVEES